MRAFIVAVLLLFAGVARADIDELAAVVRVTMPSTIAIKHNVSSFAHPGTGQYTVTLTRGGPTTGAIVMTVHHTAGTCWADWTNGTTIAVTCRRFTTDGSLGALVDIPAGISVNLVAYRGSP